jgi:hypothetical protein
MANIIIPKKPGEEKYPFMELVANPQKGYDVVRAICKYLDQSFKTDEALMGRSFREKIQTQREVDRRTEILCKWFEILRRECSYSTERALAVLPQALRTELDGGKFEPPKAEGMFAVPNQQGDKPNA